VPQVCGRLGDQVIPRAHRFFSALADAGEQGLESRELARLLGEDTPRMIASLLGNSLKKRAKALRLPFPWAAHKTLEDRTLWLDREGIAACMAEALVRQERERFDVEPRRAR
jgi:hypothetical protein